MTTTYQRDRETRRTVGGVRTTRTPSDAEPYSDMEHVEDAEQRLVKGLWTALALALAFWTGVGLLVFPAPLIELVRAVVR